PASERLVRAARRMATGLRAPWVAVWVEPVLKPLLEADRERLDGHLRLAESLGAEVVRLGGARPAGAILAYARHHNVSRIILGKPPSGGILARLRDTIRGSLHDELVRESGDIDVHVITGDAPGDRAADPGPGTERGPGRANFLAAGGLVAAAALVSALGRDTFAPPDVVALFLSAIMLAAARIGRGPALFAAGLSVAVYDFFFVTPHFTFAVSDARHILTFALMFGVGVLISALTQRIRSQELAARAREERTAALYSLSRELAGASDPPAVARVLATEVARVFSASTAVLVRGARDGELTMATEVGEVLLDTQERGVLRWVLDHARAAGLGTPTLPGARITGFPLLSDGAVVGVLAVSPRTGRRSRAEDRLLLEAFVRQGALALGRAVIGEDARAAALRVRTEEMRSALLSSVSHDLRTPLATITGAATTLRDERGRLPEDTQRELLGSICDEAERLERLVGNLLDMTRLESGALEPRRELVPIEEIFGSALGRLEHALAGRDVRVEVDPTLPFVAVDPALVEQLLTNLLDNAAKHSAPDTPIEVEARHAAGEPPRLVIEVRDRGPGLSAEDAERAFEKFYRGRTTATGAGLGLAICRAIAAVHGGTLSAANRAGGGARFVAELPLDAPAVGDSEGRTPEEGFDDD
ncbi:MAG: sensor histidine kinase KdpD, partial [Myxococcales bacterium]|nr:sensor histidine kinase KdpD [Myxococcales bacterium]